MFVCKKTVFSFFRHAELGSASMNRTLWTLKQVQGDGVRGRSGRRACLGRSMIEMLGVLALIGVISIGVVAGYRLAMNKYHANTILDDVNRYAFAIIEKGSFPVHSNIEGVNFTKTSIYEMVAFVGVKSGQYGIMVENVPNGVCEALVEKASVNYKVRVMPADTTEYIDQTATTGVFYDSLHEDVCTNGINDVVLHFGDVSGTTGTEEEPASVFTPNGWTEDDNSNCPPQTKLGECSVCVSGGYVDSDAVCIKKKGVGSICLDGFCRDPVPLTGNGCMSNTDCANKKTSNNEDCGTSSCYCNYNYNNVSGCYQTADSITDIGNGTCVLLGDAQDDATTVTVGGKDYIYTNFVTTWWGAKNFCQSHHMRMMSYEELGCSYTDGTSVSCPADSIFMAIKKATWTSNPVAKDSCGAYFITPKGF